MIQNASRSTDSADVPSKSTPAPQPTFPPELQASLGGFLGSLMASHQVMVDELRRINPNFQAPTVTLSPFISVGPPTSANPQPPELADQEMRDVGDDEDDDDDADLRLS